MHFKRVEPAQAVEWIGGAVRLLLANPAPFLLMGLAMTVIAVVPLLGAMALLIIGPVFYAGIASAARTQNEGGQADFDQLLEGFRQPGKAGPLIALCLPSVAFVLMAVMLGVMVLMSSGAAALMAESAQPIDPSTVDPAVLFGSSGLLVLVLLLIPLGIATAAVLFFALPRVMFDGIEPFPALRESAQAAAANLGAFLLTVITLFFARALLAMLLSWLPFFLGALIVGSVFTPLIACVLYLAWKDVFARTAEDALDRGNTPMPPPMIEV